MTNNEQSATVEDNRTETGDTVDGRKTAVEFLYFIACGDDFVKIGRARDVWQRLRHLQTGNPIPLRLLLALPFAAGDIGGLEADVHRKMRLRHERGEWFRCSIDDLFMRVWTIATRGKDFAVYANKMSGRRQAPDAGQHGAIVSDEFAATIRRAAERASTVARLATEE